MDVMVTLNVKWMPVVVLNVKWMPMVVLNVSCLSRAFVKGYWMLMVVLKVSACTVSSCTVCVMPELMSQAVCVMRWEPGFSRLLSTRRVVV